MVKPYNWEEIKSVIMKELNHIKHIMTFGTIGSCNVEHDIDLIVTKKPSSRTRLFFEELHNLFFNLDSYLMKKYNAHAVRFSTSEEEFLVEALLENPQKNVSFHTHVYLSLPSMERDWNWALGEGDTLKDIVLNGYSCLIGKPKDLFGKEFSRKSDYDHVYIFLYKYDKINSYYPDNLFVKAMSHYLDYLY